MAPQVDIRVITPDEIEKARLFLASCGWGRRVQDPERFQRMISGSWRVVVAVANGEVIGFARALSDGVSNGYLSMVAVQGSGRALVEQLVGGDPRVTWVLRAGRESQEFWSSLGFERSQITMERVRRE